MTSERTTALFEPDPSCASGARRFVTRALETWGLGRFQEDAALCVAELATNAFLHCRRPFTVSVRAIPGGIRIDVQDDRPDRLPVQLPKSLDPLASGSTGRGLKLVAAMSTRWGYFTTGLAKTVWVELTDKPEEASTEPVVELAARPANKTARPVRLKGLPTLAAIASGVQIDDLVREVQLEPGRIAPEDRAELERLLDRSAAPRLIGRQEAFRAAGRGLESYDLELAISADELRALGELVAFLEGLAESSVLEAGRVSPEVEAMRAWLPGEVSRQFEGRAPSRFPGAASPEPGGRGVN